MRFPTALLFSCLLVLVRATLTDPSQWPGLNNLPNCVQNVFGGCSWDCSYGGGCIPCYVGCGTWTCACSQFAGAISAASSVAASGCSTNQANAIASATSIVNGFCSQLLATPAMTGPMAPSSPPTETRASSTGMKWFPPYSTTRLNRPNRTIGWWWWW
jgi:hypothetical protein